MVGKRVGAILTVVSPSTYLLKNRLPNRRSSIVCLGSLTVRADHRCENRDGAWADNPAVAATAGRRGSSM